MTEIDDLLSRIARENPGPCTPGAFYSPAGDCVFVFTEDTPHDAERVDDVLTLYRALDAPRRIVGLQIQGLRSAIG